ncbi:flagellar assembly peptidoglycan hydrolase FlgJ [Fluoribacter dumoffii]|uniref:Peptidoglycan hydrolase FlgJ n=1 Tax=Fluoribacter dumoffii TaxID=463 RepID=A0A377GAC2_9GAMM|nr:flagellar assembly peptidoglycan hydrolase FlgJ [Fluoribacter dumoffii]KTC88922.1 muramidase, peptidoglycan hydrolase FlgJ [Fluoribacter dumoffii NY 23]MCW8385866.1 flagellar assembly peptidoglycan hydrolase FlgJ [Fluoribacter dumoffii]MCW8418919.1 flagellar assembly peptidoglycan hydrolase FlgJ [Fluoribacter dumoffii]MCW8453237.1 flagellar assembly peptidoglycan hydrolase FlgJ [Fluoribacter dumoffii]MCW8459542.1 flagellar assembly peptidoglycan hydrolase FlgJ [Fluoribacter dumoffii]
MSVHGIATSDFNALNELKVKAQNNEKEALPEAAKQFEGIFLQAMLKSMRMGQHFLEESSPFRGKDRETFQDMLDAQYASVIANSKGIGLGDMLTRQMEHNLSTTEQPQKTAAAKMASPSSVPAVQTKQSKDDKPSTPIDEFVKSIWPKAKQAASVIGLDPKILIAQAALETGWGKYITKDSEGTSSNNLFNIKSNDRGQYDSVTVKTTEYIADTPIKVNASFRKYPSIEDSFNDYISLIKDGERYQNALASVGNPEVYINELHKAGYATDPEYGTKILSIYHGDELNQAIQQCELTEQA